MINKNKSDYIRPSQIMSTQEVSIRTIKTGLLRADVAWLAQESQVQETIQQILCCAYKLVGYVKQSQMAEDG